MNVKSLSALLGAVVVFVVVALLPSSASAATAPTPSGNPTTHSAARGCTVTPREGVSGANVRLRANAESTRLGVIQPGESAPASCDATEGGSYSACGGGNWWIQVTWGGRTGYVAARCVDWFTE